MFGYLAHLGVTALGALDQRAHFRGGEECVVGHPPRKVHHPPGTGAARRLTSTAPRSPDDLVLGPLGDQAPLEMRDRAENVKHQFAGSRVGIDPHIRRKVPDPSTSLAGQSR